MPSWQRFVPVGIGCEPSVLVVDTSAVLNALSASSVDHLLLSRLASGGSLHAPHLIDAELLHALRGLVKGGVLAIDRVQSIREDFADLRIIRYPITGIADRVWQLRDNLSAYDACFVSLAEALHCPLITSDGRLARSVGHTAAVELFDGD